MNNSLKCKFEKLEITSFAREMIEFIDDSPSPYHVAKNCSIILDENGFTRLEPKDHWELKKGGKYYFKKSNSSILAFTLGTELDLSKGFKVFAAHTDSPTLRIKPNPITISGNIVRLNTEVYGGPILSTWFDRPLSIAGRLVLKTDDIFRPKTICINFDEPLLILPNLCIHQNRDVNNGYKIDKQKDLLPIISLVNDEFEKDNYLLKMISNKLDIKISDILDFDLNVYALEKGCLLGANQEFISSTKMDNLLSVYAGLLGLVEAEDIHNQINIFIAFDNEEIGSATKQGADSNYLSNALERIIYSLGYTRNDFLQMLSSSFMLSADSGHAAHPSFMNKQDITNICKMNEGVLIKMSANQKYTSDGYSNAIIKSIVEGTDIKLQYFVNNSNEIGGSTIGPLSSKHLDIDSIDIGVPILAMHSVRELSGINDVFHLKELGKEFFNKN